MDELDKQEEAQIALVDGAAEKAKQTIRDYFAMQRSFLGGVLASSNKPSLPATGQTGPYVNPFARSEPKRTTAKFQDTIDVVLSEIRAHPKDQFTFPEIKDSLAQRGITLSRDQLRRVMEAIIGKAPVFQVSPRSGSVAGVYSKTPVNGSRPELDLPAFTNHLSGQSLRNGGQS